MNTTLPPQKTSRTALSVMAGGLVLSCLLAVIHTVGADDHWWHLLTGRLILEQQAVPVTDPFSFTFAGKPWVNWEWLSGVLMWLSWQALGPAGLVFLRAASLALALWALLAHLGRMERGDNPWRILVTGLLLSLAMLVLLGRMADRPHWYSLAVIAAFHLAARRFVSKPGLASLAPLALLLVVWVPLHPSWSVGLAVLGALVADAALVCLRRGDHKALTTLCLWCLALLPVSALAFALLPMPLDYAGSVAAIFQNRNLHEWQSTFHYLSVYNLPLFAFLALALAWVWAVATSGKRSLTFENLLVAFVLFMALRHVRFTTIFSLLALPTLGAFLLERAAALAPPSPSRLTRLALLAALLTLAATFNFNHTRSFTPGLSIDNRFNPTGLTSFMKAHAMQGRLMANRMEVNAFCLFDLWPRVRVYIDGRVPQLYPASFHEAYKKGGDPAPLNTNLDQWQVDFFVYMGDPRKPLNPTNETLLKRRDYLLVYFDDVSALFVRRAYWETLTRKPGGFAILNPWVISPTWADWVLERKFFDRLVADVKLMNATARGTDIAGLINQGLASYGKFSPRQKKALTAAMGR